MPGQMKPFFISTFEYTVHATAGDFLPRFRAQSQPGFRQEQLDQ